MLYGKQYAGVPSCWWCVFGRRHSRYELVVRAFQSRASIGARHLPVPGQLLCSRASSIWFLKNNMLSWKNQLVVCFWVVWSPGIHVTTRWSGHSNRELQKGPRHLPVAGKMLCLMAWSKCFRNNMLSWKQLLVVWFLVVCFNGIRVTIWWSEHSNRESKKGRAIYQRLINKI